MKKILLFSVLALGMIACSPKSVGNAVGNAAKDVVTKGFMNMISLNNEGKWSDVLDMTYPKLFDIAPKEQLLQQFQQMDMLGLKMVTDNVKIGDLSEFIPSGNEEFAKFNYTGVQTISAADPSIMPMMKQQLEMAMGADKIKEADGKLLVDVDQEVYVIKDKGTQKMYFMQSSPQMAPMMGQLIPADVLEKLK